MDIGESLSACVEREVREETGLRIDVNTVRVCGLWESCYPTSYEECIKREENGVGGIMAHYLVVFCVCQTRKDEKRESVILQEEEVDFAIWLTPEAARILIANPLGGIAGQFDVTSACSSSPSLENEGGIQSIDLDELAGIYPRGNDMCGIAQGSLFMLEELLRQGWGKDGHNLI